MPAAVPIATLAVGAFSANRQAGAARRGANAQQAAAEAATAEQRRQFDLTRQDQLPFLQAGTDALARQQAFLNGDRSGFENDAGYQFIRDEQQRGLERGAASRGALYNGGTSVDLLRQMTGLANQTAGDYLNRLAVRAGQGQTSASNLGGLGAMMANNIGNNMMNAGAARASSYQDRANALSGTAFGALGAFNSWYNNNSAANGGGSGWYLGRQPGRG